MSDIVVGKIVRWDEDGSVLVRATVPSLDRALNRKYDKVLCEFPDGRKRSPEQLRKAHALIGEISEWSGELPEDMKRILKVHFAVDHIQTIGEKMFSMKDCSMTLCREFISWLIDFMIEHGVPSRIPLYEQCEDIQRYVYACMMNKRCAICGRHSDVHHIGGSRLGHGGLKWRTKNQAGAIVLPLCRKHHQEAHLGEKELLEKYHLQGIEFTKDMAKLYGAKMEE
jgi:hypothetical protein